MKKTFILASVLAFAAFNAGAQTMYDALRYSENNYYGTARSVAMGNAFTALGGDLGSIGINPAGSAVNNYSQFTLTPNVSIISTSSKYNSTPSSGNAYGDSYGLNKARFTMPNFGAMTVFNTHKTGGLKRVTFGFVGNATANYLDNMAGRGQNDRTSYLGYLASDATGYPSSGLNSYDYAAGYPWRSMVAYQSGMIATYDNTGQNYIGATEKLYKNSAGEDEISLAGPVNQRYGREGYGNKYDFVFNVGFDFSDIFYVGANLGLTSIDYTSNSYFKEAAVSTSDFENQFESGTTYFSDMRFRENYEATGTGVYGKFGFIVLPVEGLRIGAAIQTPTANYITEKWQYAGETYFTDAQYNAYAVSDEGSYDYKLVSPYRVNVGAAYTFPYGVISADYEMTDYSKMKFKERGTNDNSGFDLDNSLIKNFYGFQHALRVGAEVKPIPEFSLRAGYNFTTSPECYWYDSEGVVDPNVYASQYNSTMTDNEFYNWKNSLYDKTYVKAYTHAFSFGVGYSSKGSFFVDLAFRGTLMPKQYTYPYENYISGTDSPEIKTRSRLYDIIATFGWRF